MAALNQAVCTSSRYEAVFCAAVLHKPTRFANTETFAYVSDLCKLMARFAG